jgi:hypothetical protein
VVQEEQGVWGKVWGILANLWSKNGGSLDPFGLLGSQPTTSSSTTFCDAGGSLDPFGRCVSSATTAGFCDNGASLDPNGHCVNGH